MSARRPPSDPVEPRYKSLMVALVPQPRTPPPLPPFDKEQLQRTFADVLAHHSYQSFGFIFDGRGAQFNNGEDDVVELRPALMRVSAKMDGPDLLTADLAAEKAIRILGIATDRLKVQGFVQCVIQIVASADAPNEDARTWVAENLMKDANHAAELGTDFFGGGVRFRRIRPEEGGEDNLTIEPDVNNNALVFLNFQLSRMATTEALTLDHAEKWTRESFDFVSGPTKRLLSS